MSSITVIDGEPQKICKYVTRLSVFLGDNLADKLEQEGANNVVNSFLKLTRAIFFEKSRKHGPSALVAKL